MTSSSSENSRLSKPEIRIRAFGNSDSNQIFELYKHAMFHGAASPVNQFLNQQLRKPLSLVLYALFTLGLGLTLHPTWPSVIVRMGPEIFVSNDKVQQAGVALTVNTTSALVRAAGLVISGSTGWLFFGWRRQIFKRYKMHFDTAPKGDLTEPGKYYWGNGTGNATAERDVTKADSPNGFWVAEVADGKDKGKIVGCIGLDISTNPDPTSAELRRMVVSPEYQRHGIGSRLVQHLLAHARAYCDAHPEKLESIWLSTSMYQMQAMKLYERYGFLEEQKKVIALKYLFITDRASLHFFKLKL